MACAPAEFETVTVPPAGLFQGALPEPNADELAAKLGLAADGDSTTYRVTCPNASFDFHRAADGVSVKFALDGVIYTLRRAERRGSASQRRP